MKEKIKHILAGALISFFIAVPVYADSNNLFAGLWACLAGVVCGGVKEWCDMHTEGNKWDWKDFSFTAVGVGIVMLFIICLHIGKG